MICLFIPNLTKIYKLVGEITVDKTRIELRQIFLRRLWNRTVHYSVHKIQPLDPLLSQINPVRYPQIHFFEISFNKPITFHLRVGVPNLF